MNKVKKFIKNKQKHIEHMQDVNQSFMDTIDTESLEVLINVGVLFTILPYKEVDQEKRLLINLKQKYEKEDTTEVPF
jgi:hypothetical protein